MRQILGIADRGRGGPQAPVPASLFQATDPRALLCIWAAYIVVLLSVQKYDITGVLALAAFPVFVTLSARLPVGAIAIRVGLLSPFVLIMAAANPFFDRTPLFTVHGFAVTSGMVSGAVIVGKGILSIAAILTLVTCVSFYRLCAALRDLRVPEVFVTQIVLLYRYSLLLVDEAMALQKARNLRSFGRRGRDISTTAKLVGSLLLRTVERATRVHKAMLARGFSGRMHHSASNRLRANDIVLGAALVVSFLGIRLIF
jgi:cobalt/nickel transport system permease protein